MPPHNAGFRNIIINDSGVNWNVSYEWLNSETGQWTLFECQFPRDFDDLLVDEVTPIMHMLATEVAKARLVHD
jgi:hypothetical protein